MISSHHCESAFSVSVYCWTIERKRMPRVVIRVGIKSRHTYLTKNLYVKNVRTVRNSQDSVIICTRLFLLPKEISQYVGLQISRYENDRCEKLRPGVLRFMGSQRVGHDWATDLIWSDDVFHNPDNHDGVITHLEPDILVCAVKWDSGSITTTKASGGDGIPDELLKDDAVKVLHSISQQIWKTQQWPQDWKRSVFLPIPKKGNAKECSNYFTIVLISHASKVILPSSYISTVHELRTFRCESWI